MRLEWNYKQKYVDVSMPGYVSKDLHKFYHAPRSKPQHSPFKFVRPNDRLRKHLLQYGYSPTPLTPGLWRHSHRPIAFTFVVDDFGIKSEDILHTNNLNNALRDLYTISADPTGSLYCDMTLEWNYK